MSPSTNRLPRTDPAPRQAGPELVPPATHGAVAKPALSPATTIPNGIVDETSLAGMLDEACFVTGATGAAIALRVGGEMVCCATAGSDAPDLGTRLVSGQGLSGACIESRQLQQTSDTETDPRVDRETCRLLGVRSIVVLPLMESGELLGIFELLSSEPKAFGHRHLSRLQILANRILESKLSQLEAEPTAAVQSATPDTMNAETRARELFLASERQESTTPRRKPWHVMQIAAVITVAVLLGWMIGRAGWKMAVDRADSPVSTPPEQIQPAAQTAPDTTPISGMPAQVTPEATSLAELTYDGRTPATDSHEGDPVAAPVRLSPKVSSNYVLKRVQPEYPEEAKQQHIQGRVVMKVLVGTNGLVQDLVVTSGDPQLVKAATNAVKQWRFKPHRLKGQQVEFETQITVNFALS